MENKNVSFFSIYKSYLLFLVLLNGIGFIFWALYQKIQQNIEILESISLFTGLCIWWFMLISVLVPKVLMKLFDVAINDVVQKQYQDNLIKMINKQIPKTIKDDSSSTHENDYTKH
jgi:hypothetical protein